MTMRTDRSVRANAWRVVPAWTRGLRSVPQLVGWMGLTLACARLTAADGASRAPAPPDRGYSYSNERVPEVPWSIHIFKVERNHRELNLVTTLGKGDRLGMDLLSEQLKGIPDSLGRPIAAVNGDFYETSRGYYGRPRDLQLLEGELITDPAGNSVFWLDPNGEPQVTNLVSHFRVLWPNGSTTPFGLNEARPRDAAVLYTARVGPSTRTSGGTEVVLEGVDECAWLPLRPGETLTARVREVRRTGNAPMAPDTLVLSFGSTLAPRLPAIEEGMLIQLLTEIVPDLRGVKTALGGGPTLVRNRKVIKGDLIEFRHPRTALGWNRDYFYLVLVDGRQGGLSAGMTLPELAEYMLRIGCDYAVNLDGGGSATFWVGGNVMNSPSEGQERPVANALVVVDRRPRTNAPPVEPAIASPNDSGKSADATPPGASPEFRRSEAAARSEAGGRVFAPGALHHIRLEIAALDLESLRARPRDDVQATVQCGEERFPRVDLHLKGSTGSFRPIDDKPAMTLDFPPKQLWDGLRRVHLNNSVEDASYLNESLGGALFRAAGVPAARVAHARVTLNGRSLGLYVVKEGFTEEFLSRSFQPAGGTLYEPRSGEDINTPMERKLGVGSPADEVGRRELAEAVVEPDAGRRWSRLEAVLDIDRFLSFMALEVVLGHRDGYCLARNNFRVYRDAESQRFVFLPHGMDQLLGNPDLPWQPHMAGLVARAVLETPEGRRRYRERLTGVLDGLFLVDALTRRIDECVGGLTPFLSAEETESVGAAAELLKRRVAERSLALRRQLAAPEPRVLDPTATRTRLTGWRAVDGFSAEAMEQTQEEGGSPVLRIAAGPTTSASWRADLVLPRGAYRFEGRVKVKGVKPLTSGRSHGACLRLQEGSRGEGRLVGDSPWREVSVPFLVDSDGTTAVFLCELRASAGEAAFSLDSLCVVRDR